MKKKYCSPFCHEKELIIHKNALWMLGEVSIFSIGVGMELQNIDKPEMVFEDEGEDGDGDRKVNGFSDEN